MSIVSKDSIEVIAQSIGINNLSSDAALELAPDVEYRMREIMQDAVKCMRHSRRTVLTVDDVDCALNLRNVEPIYGIASGDPLRFKRAMGHKDLYYIEDKDVDLKDIIEAPLPKAPLDAAVMCHWLAIEGVQPAIPENAPVQGISVLKMAMELAYSCHNGMHVQCAWFICDVLLVEEDTFTVCSDTLSTPETKAEQKEEVIPVDIRLPVKHVLSRELQLYFEKITELTIGRSDSLLFKEGLMSLATDAGLHPLVPYFTCFIADEVSRGLGDFALLFALMRVVQSLLQNPHIHIEPYVSNGLLDFPFSFLKNESFNLCNWHIHVQHAKEDIASSIHLALQPLLHQLMPSVVTCLVAKRLGNRLADNHWELRDFTANLVASICKRFGHVSNRLQTRLTKTLLTAFLDPKKALTQHYGAIKGLAALGPNVVRQLILPNLEPYMRLLEPELLLEKQKNEMKRHEAWRVFGALLHAAGQCIYNQLKKFPALPSPPAHTIWRNNKRVVTLPIKRKACMNLSEEQPTLKKVDTDGPMDVDVLQPNVSQSDGQEDASVSNPLIKTDVVPSSPSGTMLKEKTSSSNGKNAGGDARALKISAMLSQIWNDDLNSGRLLVSLFDQFGESMFSFIPSPELALFL
ncbi:TATA box binding protein associated factor (TAF), histone-like fold domain [Dillenia turbinata]|uniref:TATA box binding protein associated factor (TAF), histone-like fold domain n=1 Tax=Dillenia turbinata TaxID=194707 RepID=A0AAN8Z3G5_9MAGN